MMANIREAVPGDAPGIARVHVESWRTTYAGIMPDDLLANLSVERRTEFWNRVLSEYRTSNHVFVALDEQAEIVGFVSGGKPQHPMEGFDGELYAIYLLQSAQGKGYGRSLFHALCQRLREAGFKTMLLWVADENLSARRFYEAMGGELLSNDKVETFGDKQVREVAYGWRDLTRGSNAV
jgi:ribosomal protein S18 acetylase RimI-like enzyme